jgi:NifB/MoaA-like Fe-S oxidoreductase
MRAARRLRRGLVVDEAGAAAARAGVRPGDLIVAIDGRPPEDVLDLTLAAADGRFDLALERAGRALTARVAPRRGEEHGIALRDGLGVPVRLCANDCSFCFVNQLPPGLRPSLAVRDDDYRLSFLQGTFVTLTNLDDHDLERIAALRLSPLFVSLHAWDDDVRARLMGASSRVARDRLAWLAAHGIEMHVQIVLCPGVNDGAVLRETVTELLGLASALGGDVLDLHDDAPDDDADEDEASLVNVGGTSDADRTGGTGDADFSGGGVRGGVIDVGIVPVSLAHAGGDLRRVTPADAAAALALVADAQATAIAAVGRRFVHAADELYLATGVLPPAGDAPAQYENGIGVCAALLAETDELPIAPESPPVALLGGTAAAPVLVEAARRLSARTGAAVRPFVVDNALFGPRVTVTGLLGGREVLAALREQPLAAGEWLRAPRTFLPAELGRTLDDVTEHELAAACGGRLALGDDLAAALAAVR